MRSANGESENSDAMLTRSRRLLKGDEGSEIWNPMERGQEGCVLAGWPTVEEPDHRHRLLLRVRRGHAAVAPPSRVMNSRRCMSSPKLRRRYPNASNECFDRGSNPACPLSSHCIGVRQPYASYGVPPSTATPVAVSDELRDGLEKCLGGFGGLAVDARFRTSGRHLNHRWLPEHGGSVTPCLTM